ncbi:MAG: ABC transporter substrate-binding protein, partial [Desulfobacterales bacterium]|nr:ABC transporter substrate-binding protein [Desulfobacterales bacterium]
MKNKLFIFSLTVVLTIFGLFSWVACSEESRETKIVVDCFGREVEVPAKIERIGTLFSVSGHVVTMLGRGKDIVAVTKGLKRDILLTSICPDILNAAEPKAYGNINIEELVRANPDVIFISEETGINKKETEKFEKLGIPYFVIKFDSIQEQKFMLEMMGNVLERSDEVERFINYYNWIIDLVSKRVADIPQEKKVRVFHSVMEAARTDSANSLAADWTQIAGVINVSVNDELRVVENTKYFANLEQIMLWDPEAIIVNEDGVDEYIRTNKQWAALKAVKDNRVYLLPNGVSRWGHPNSIETPLAILWTAKTLYPEYFQDVSLEKETKYFYQQF